MPSRYNAGATWGAELLERMCAWLLCLQQLAEALARPVHADFGGGK